ncbi:MAG TPA: hypothetical protein VJ576_16195 [Rhodocyclaceae bacterium]|nr:hypothetical protein [Rhodocyclaceae bacterium]
MPPLNELEQYDDTVFKIELDTIWKGGDDGDANKQALALANRTKWLKAQVAALGTGKQPLDATLTALAAIVTAADKLIYATGPDTFATTTLSAFIRTLLDDADAATARATLGAASPADINAAIAALVNSSPAALDTLNELATALGDDPNFAATMTAALAAKQPLDATLTALAAMVTAADKLIYATGVDTFATTTLSAFIRTLLDDADAATARVTLGAAPSIVGAVRNAKMSVMVASSTATFTADEVVVESSLGGEAYKIANFNKTINLATTGAGGMDTGAAPPSGYVALYAIYNPITGTSALLAVNATSAAAPNVYGGANMPAGYAASALLSVWPTNASSQFQVGFQRDRKIWRSSVQVMNGGAATAWTAISLTPAVPPNALSISGSMHNITNTSGGGPIMLAGDTSGTGQQQVGGGGVTNSGFLGSFSDVPVIAQQTTYYQTLSTITSDVNITAYTF